MHERLLEVMHKFRELVVACLSLLFRDGGRAALDNKCFFDGVKRVARATVSSDAIASTLSLGKLALGLDDNNTLTHP